MLEPPLTLHRIDVASLTRFDPEQAAGGGAPAMPAVPEYRAADNAHPPAALIKAALLHNDLPLEEGFTAFDVVSRPSPCASFSNWLLPTWFPRFVPDSFC